MASWKGLTAGNSVPVSDGAFAFYLITTMIPWVVLVITLLAKLFNIHVKLTFIDFKYKVRIAY